MKAYEFAGEVTTEGQLKLPEFALAQLAEHQAVRVIVPAILSNSIACPVDTLLSRPDFVNGQRNLNHNQNRDVPLYPVTAVALQEIQRGFYRSGN